MKQLTEKEFEALLDRQIKTLSNDELAGSIEYVCRDGDVEDSVYWLLHRRLLDEHRTRCYNGEKIPLDFLPARPGKAAPAEAVS